MTDDSFPRARGGARDPDRQGDKGWSLGQARMMLRQGYSLAKVQRLTGWGENWLRDLVDYRDRRGRAEWD